MPQQICPNCCQTYHPRDHDHASSLHEPQDEIALIRAKASHIDEVNTKLQVERAALMRRLNSLQSATRALPVETLSYIFRLASPAPDYTLLNRTAESNVMTEGVKPYFHFVLASVSSSWHDIVHATPSLWNSIQLPDVEPEDVEECTMYLRMSFEKSRGLPLDFGFEGAKPCEGRDDFIFSEELDRLFFEHCHRIRSLCIQGFLPSKWFTELQRLVGLTHLVVNSSTLADVSGLELSYPPNHLLTHLNITSASRKLNIDTISSSLTILSLCFVPIDLCLQSLIQHPSLVEFRCVEPSVPGEDTMPPVLSTPLVLDKLEFLEWTFLPGAFSCWNLTFMTRIEVPALKTLRWAEDTRWSQDPHDDHDHIPAFLARLPRTLEEINFWDVSYSSFARCNLIKYIRGDSLLKSFRLEMCSQALLLAVLRRLQKRENGSLPFPHLDRVKVQLTMSEAHKNAAYFEGNVGIHLADALEQRSAEIDRFSFTVRDVQWWNFYEPVMDRLLKLRNNGLDLRILDGEDDIFAEFDMSSDVSENEATSGYKTLMYLPLL